MQIALNVDNRLILRISQMKSSRIEYPNRFVHCFTDTEKPKDLIMVDIHQGKNEDAQTIGRFET